MLFLICGCGQDAPTRPVQVIRSFVVGTKKLLNKTFCSNLYSVSVHCSCSLHLPTQLASHLFYSIEIIPYLFYSEVFAIKPVLLTQSTNRKSKNQFKDSLLNVLCHYISIFYLLLLTSFVVRTPGLFGSAWTAINSRYD